MNPEVRFRVPESIYRLAEQKAEEILRGDYPGRSTAVSTLARKAFYQVLEAPVEEDAGGVAAVVEVEIHYRLSEEARRRSLLEEGRAVPATARTVLQLRPQEVPPEVAPWLTLTGQGQARVVLHWEEHAEAEEFTMSQVVSRLRAIEDMAPPTLRAWAEKHGSELLRLRVEEGFEWLDLARQELAIKRLQGLGPLTPVREQAGLGPGEEPSHTVLPDRQPGLERMHQLRAIRARVPQGVEVQLVRVRGGNEAPAALREGILLRLTLPDGHRLAFLVGDSPTPSRTSTKRPRGGLSPD